MKCFDLKCFDIISVNNFIRNYFHRSISQVEKPEIVVSPNFLRNSGTFSKPSCLWYIWDDLKANHFRKRLDSSNSSKNPDKPSKQTNLKTIRKLFSCHRLHSIVWCYKFSILYYLVVFGNGWLWLTMRRCWFGNRNIDCFSKNLVLVPVGPLICGNFEAMPLKYPIYQGKEPQICQACHIANEKKLLCSRTGACLLDLYTRLMHFFVIPAIP